MTEAERERVAIVAEALLCAQRAYILCDRKTPAAVWQLQRAVELLARAHLPTPAQSTEGGR